MSSLDCVSCWMMIGYGLLSISLRPPSLPPPTSLASAASCQCSDQSHTVNTSPPSTLVYHSCIVTERHAAVDVSGGQRSGQSTAAYEDNGRRSGSSLPSRTNECREVQVDRHHHIRLQRQRQRQKETQKHCSANIAATQPSSSAVATAEWKWQWKKAEGDSSRAGEEGGGCE